MSTEITPSRIDVPELEVPGHLARDLRECLGKAHGFSRKER